MKRLGDISTDQPVASDCDKYYILFSALGAANEVVHLSSGGLDAAHSARKLHQVATRVAKLVDPPSPRGVRG